MCIRDSFIGGGSVAIHITKKYPHLDIWVNDLYEPLYNFWCILRDEPQDLCEVLKEYKSKHSTPELAKELFLQMKTEVGDKENPHLQRAAAFYVINKCSFSGLTESSSFSKQASDQNFSLAGIERLRDYQKLIGNWKITNLSYE